MNAQHVGWVRLGAMIAGFLMAASALLSPAGAQGTAPSTAQPQQQKLNVLFIIGDDIGWMQVGVYHRSLALGAIPNIDRIGQEAAVFPITSARPVVFFWRTVIEQPISGGEKG